MISICIPTYEQHGYGHTVLQKLLDSIQRQVCDVPFEVIVSDNSDGELVEWVCRDYPVRYVRNPIRGCSANFNNAIGLAKYPIIKPMCQDDVFWTDDALQAFAETDGWTIANSYHIGLLDDIKRHPQTRFEPGPLSRYNTVGMPSAIAYRKADDLTFDERFATLLDLILYHQLYAKYGPPRVINERIIGQRFWFGHTSANLDNGREEMERAVALYDNGELNLSHRPCL